MKVYFERKVLWGFFMALGILIVLGIYSFKTSRDSINTSRLIARTNEVLYHIEQLHSSHLELEAAVMRFSMTGDSSFAGFFSTRIKEAAIHYSTLREMTRENSRQQVNLDGIQLLGRKKVDLIKKVIAARKHSVDSVRRLVPSSYNDSLLKSVNAVIEDMQSEEKSLLDGRMTANKQELENFYSILTTLVIVAAVIVIVLFVTINANLRARLRAEEALKSASQQISDLYNNAPCGYHSIDKAGIVVEMNNTWLKWLGRKRDEVVNKLKFVELLTPKSIDVFERNFNVLKTQGSVGGIELEVIRKNREKKSVIVNDLGIADERGDFSRSRSTAFDITERAKAEQKVVEINKELEAFTYSVSHDLRAPLRSIDGYSKILQEEYGQHMDAETSRLLGIVRRNAKRMGHLIDDLLEFSRMGRKEISMIMIDMNSLVESIKQELLALETDRSIEFAIQPLKDAMADVSMIRQVWVNIISNALKYTRKKEVSKIEVGCQDEAKRVVYYIRDNGVGFDMQYAGKLFGVFQRLHKIEEFEGTGVGLALVHRIVNRHGGKIWAESSVDEGATFYFFLPKT